MITSLVRSGLRLIAVVALFALVFIPLFNLNEQRVRMNKETATQAMKLAVAESRTQTYTAPADYELAPFKYDDYTVVIPKPAPKPAVKPQAAIPRKPSVASAKSYALSRLGSVQYACLNNIAVRESGWNPTIANPNGGAYGIPQALPGSKMVSAGADWRTNPVTQVKWMIGYVNARYGSSCLAWAYWQSHSNY